MPWHLLTFHLLSQVPKPLDVYNIEESNKRENSKRRGECIPVIRMCWVSKRGKNGEAHPTTELSAIIQHASACDCEQILTRNRQAEFESRLPVYLATNIADLPYQQNCGRHPWEGMQWYHWHHWWQDRKNNSNPTLPNTLHFQYIHSGQERADRPICALSRWTRRSEKSQKIITTEAECVASTHIPAKLLNAPVVSRKYYWKVISVRSEVESVTVFRLITL